MTKLIAKISSMLTAFFVLVILVSYTQESLPEVPAFETLGFEDALNVVRQKMLTAYERSQEDPRSPERNGHNRMRQRQQL